MNMQELTVDSSTLIPEVSIMNIHKIVMIYCFNRNLLVYYLRGQLVKDDYEDLLLKLILPANEETSIDYGMIIHLRKPLEKSLSF